MMVQLGIAVGLALVLAGGALFAFWPADLYWANWLLIIMGLGLMGATLWAAGRGMKRTRYRRATWRERDTLLAILSLGSIAIMATYKWLDPAALVYNPYPRLSAPAFDPVLALALVALVSPALIITNVTDYKMSF